VSEIFSGEAELFLLKGAIFFWVHALDIKKPSVRRGHFKNFA
jgi:hypothetical protein